MSQTKDYRKTAVVATCIDPNNQLFNEKFTFESVKEAIGYLKPSLCPTLSPALMTQLFNGKCKQCCGFTFEKVTLDNPSSEIPKEHKEVQLQFTKDLELSPKGKPLNNLSNTILIISKDPRLMGNLSFNELSNKILYEGKPITDYDEDTIALYVEEYLGAYNDQHIQKAINHVAHKNSFHPIKDIIVNLEWDGVKRVDEILINILGATDNQLNRILTKKWFYGLMKRLFEPGCNWDNMLIIHDNCGGTGKSTFAQRIALDEYCTTNIDIYNLSDKDNIAKLNSNWIINFDELAQFDKSDMDRLKGFLTEKRSTARLAYRRNDESYERHCVFYGSTNQDNFLRDYTDVTKAERRFWVVECNGTPHDQNWWNKNFSDSIRDQVLAEAYYFYKNNPKFNYELNSEEQQLLYEVQCKYKTSNGDVALKSLVKMLHKDKFPINSTYTMYSFHSIYKDISNGIRCPQDEVINVIPVDYIRNIFKYKSEGFITSVFNGVGWRKDVYMWDGDVIECYIRKGYPTNIRLNNNGKYVPVDLTEESNSLF